MTVDYQKLNQVVTPIAATGPDVVFWLEQTNISPGTWYTSVDRNSAAQINGLNAMHWQDIASSRRHSSEFDCEGVSRLDYLRCEDSYGQSHTPWATVSDWIKRRKWGRERAECQHSSQSASCPQLPCGLQCWLVQCHDGSLTVLV